MDLLIVHGSKLLSSGKLSVTTIKRLDRAIQVLKDHPSIKRIVLSGGAPVSGYTETHQMHSYLIQWNIDTEVVEESSSTNTVQNVYFSSKLIYPHKIKDIHIVVGENMLLRTKMIYKIVCSNIYPKTNWVAVHDDYQGRIEILWLILSAIYAIYLTTLQ